MRRAILTAIGFALAYGCAGDKQAQREDDENKRQTAVVVIEKKRTRQSSEADAARIRAEREARRAELAQLEAEKTRRELEQARLAQKQLARELEEERERARVQELALQDEQRARIAAEEGARSALEQIATVREEARGLVVTLSTPLLFGFDNALLLPSAEARLDAIAEALRASGGEEFIIEGHSDSSGSDAYNIDLSRRRAEAVRSYLIARGVEPERVRAYGWGEHRPLASNDSAEGRAQNRRVEIILPNFGVGGAGGSGLSPRK